jgi:hypothetical protein
MFVSAIAAPGIAAPELSVTVPRIDELADCALAIQLKLRSCVNTSVRITYAFSLIAASQINESVPHLLLPGLSSLRLLGTTTHHSAAM